MPFLKWPGGKSRLVEEIGRRLPPGRRLIEPFAGSCAVSLALDYDEYWLNDINPDLISLYTVLTGEGPAFVDYCASLFTGENNTADVYYELRDEFNTTADPVRKAALFVYLNRHCFNGLVRYNQQGEFNTPYGKYRAPYFPREEMLFFARRFKGALFTCLDFPDVIKAAVPGDVIYADPPYIPLSASSSFVAYARDGFSLDRQRELAFLLKEAAARGVPSLVSNSDTPFTRSVFAGVQHLVTARRSIAASGTSRGPISELLISFVV